jgi:ribosomal-protein-alanine N-acetyltransferase
MPEAVYSRHFGFDPQRVIPTDGECSPVKARTPFNLPLTPAPSEVTWLAPDDHRWIIGEVERASRRHLHLDWQILPEMLRSDDFRCRVVRQGGRIRSVVGASAQASAWHTERVAWIRLLLPGDHARSEPSLDHLWDTLRADLKAEGISQVGLLALEPWVEQLVSHWGFEHANSVITLMRRRGSIPVPAAGALRVREITQDDLDAVAALDGLAFDPFWHHSRAGLETAWKQAATFTVLENDGELLGYQLSTWHIDSGHLARLAVRPDSQGQGLGGLLVGEMLRFFDARRVSQITVNTQADNFASQRLYQRLGFEPADHSVDFWTTSLT